MAQTECAHIWEPVDGSEYGRGNISLEFLAYGETCTVCHSYRLYSIEFQSWLYEGLERHIRNMHKQAEAGT
jgi:hypothetical protein